MRKNEKKATTTQTGATDYSGAFKSYDITPEEQSVAEFMPNQALFDAGTKATEVAHKLVYVEQVTPPTGETVEKISLYIA